MRNKCVPIFAPPSCDNATHAKSATFRTSVKNATLTFKRLSKPAANRQKSMNTKPKTRYTQSPVASIRIVKVPPCLYPNSATGKLKLALDYECDCTHYAHFFHAQNFSSKRPHEFWKMFIGTPRLVGGWAHAIGGGALSRVEGEVRIAGCSTDRRRISRYHRPFPPSETFLTPKRERNA